MINVEEAIQLVHENVQLSEIIEVDLDCAVGHVLAEDLVCNLNLPQFDQSAIDGYAIQFSDNRKHALIGEIKAGDSATIPVEAGKAVRIFTGAPIPPGADTVVMQEHVEIQNGDPLLINI